MDKSPIQTHNSSNFVGNNYSQSDSTNARMTYIYYRLSRGVGGSGVKIREKVVVVNNERSLTTKT